MVVSASDTFLGDNTYRATHTESFNLVNSSDTVLLAVITGNDSPDFTFSAVYDAGGSNSAMTQLALISNGTAGGNNAFSTIFGISLGSVSAGSVDLTWNADTGNSRGTMSIFQLSNATLAGFSATGSTTNAPSTGVITTSLTGLSTGSLMLSGSAADNNSVGYNNGGNSGLSGSPVPIFTDWQDEGAYVNTLFYTTNASGTVTHEADPSNASSLQALASVGIASIPEPSSVFLVVIGMSGALLVSKRRK